jgi:hypothetical protein
VAPVDDPTKPMSIAWVDRTEAVQSELRTVTSVPLWAGVPPHIDVTLWPLGKDQRSVHPAQATGEMFVTVTEARNPPGHWLTRR